MDANMKYPMQADGCEQTNTSKDPLKVKRRPKILKR
jgi:hypothetical protein